ncbi:uncharacterized protein [Euwallacea fornicatus]|uniref:uncharacterized protein isoform X3 n=1 Tax=Euwallacea fornicatus TaxID=995702 RepID=UPI00338D577C
MDNPGEILRLCRLCLVKDQVNIPIFEEQGDIRQTFLKIRSCLPVKVSRDDKLPKKICGGCSNKLDLFYEFWSSTANSEKTLQSWLGQEEEDDKMQEITKPVEALVKEESEALDDGHAHDQSFDEATKDEAEAPPAKRARRTAAVKAQINISHDSDEDEDVDGAEPITKIEDESDDSDGEEKDPSYTEVPGTSADDQAGPSGLGKDGVEAPSIVELSSFCDLCYKEFDAFSYHTCGDVVTRQNNNLMMRPYNVKQAEKDDQMLVIDMTLESESDDCNADTEKDLHVTEDADHNLMWGELVAPSESHNSNIVSLESNSKTKEAKIEKRLPCESGKTTFTEISAPIVQETLVKPQYSYVSKNDIAINIKSNSKPVDEKALEELNNSKTHRLSEKRFRTANALSAAKIFTDKNPLGSSDEKAPPIKEDSEEAQSEKCPGNVYSRAVMIDVILPKRIPQNKAVAGPKNDEITSCIKESLIEIGKMSGERNEKNYLRAIDDSATTQKQYLSKNESSEIFDELPTGDGSDMKIDEADTKLKKPKAKLHSLEGSFAKNDKRESPSRNSIDPHESSSKTTDTAKEVTPPGSSEVTKTTQLESIGGTKHSSNLQTMASVKENQESELPTDSRQTIQKRKNFIKTTTRLEGAETSSSKEIKSSSEALQGASLSLVKGKSTAVRKSNFSSQKKLEKSNAIFICTLCDCNFKLKGDVMIHYIMRHHCEAPESSLLPVKARKSTIGPGKNLLDVASKTTESYIECESGDAKMADVPMKKLKQKKIVTLQQYKENRTFFNTKYDSDSSGSSTSLENFKDGTTQRNAKKVLTLQQYKAMKLSKFNFSCNSDYCSSSTGKTVGLEENLNQSALQETRVASFFHESGSEKNCVERDCPSYCEICGFQFNDSECHAHHMNFVHPGFSLKCFVCGTSCGNFDSLIKHQRKHSEFQILIGEKQFLRTRKSGPNQPYPYYCTFCGAGFTLVKMLLTHKLSLQCRATKTGEVACNDVVDDLDEYETNDVAGVADEVVKSNVPDTLNEVEKENIPGDLNQVEEGDLADDSRLKIDEAVGEKDSDCEQTTVNDAVKAGASNHRNHRT